MSRSQPSLTNPAKHFFEWKGGKGELEFYDKEQEKRITVPLPFEFLVLDQLSKITGYSKVNKSSFYSNEVRNSTKEEFVVKMKKSIAYTGLYKNEQGIPQVPRGAGFAKSIYIAHKSKGGYIMGNLTAAGSALGAWIEFNGQHKVDNGKVIMRKGEQQESEVGPFFAPVFEYVSATDEENLKAIELDRELQIYLSQYLATASSNRSSEDNTTPAWPSEQGNDDLDDVEAQVNKGIMAEDAANLHDIFPEMD